MTTTDLPAANAFARFRAIHGELCAAEGRDGPWLRFAAQAALTAGEPHEVAASITEAAAALRAESGVHGALHTPLRFVIAAMLVQAGDWVPSFVADLERTCRLFREAGIVHGGADECLAILLLRLANGLRPASREQAVRLRGIHARLRVCHWWSTGPQDLPGCALLLDLPGTPEEVGQEVEHVYRLLRDDGFAAGAHLVQAAVVLALARLPATRAAHRFATLVERFALDGAPCASADHPAVALLCLVELAPALVVERVLDLHRRSAALHPLPARRILFDLAAHLAVVELVGRQRRPGCSADSVAQVLRLTMRDAQAVAAIIACHDLAAADPAQPVPAHLAPANG